MRAVGIDLGTTHSALAYCDDDQPPQLVPIAQAVGATQQEALPLLASALHAAPGEDTFQVGAFALSRARELPGRSITSAKSWLSNRHVVRTEPILPWASDDPSAPRRSPLQASAEVLEHLVRAAEPALGPRGRWDVTLTVPASFDEAARSLTLQAAQSVGLTVRLLEEPIAAFLQIASESVQGALDGVRRVLVIDVGGGTTDFSLLERHGAGGEGFRRVATGQHLLLGGDNVDLALAQRVEARLGGELSPMRFAQLLGVCRRAKEQLLGEQAPEQVSVVLAPQGASLVAGSLRCSVSRAEVLELVCDGFLPRVALDAPPQRKSALRSFGLPYERDSAITRHLAAFLRDAGGEPFDAIAFNGGFFRSAELVQRVLAQLHVWFGRAVRVLPNAEPDVAVARGAARYGRDRQLGRVQVEARDVRSHWLRLEGDQALCVLPRGTAEATPVHWPTPLQVLRGEPVRFELQSDGEPGTPRVRPWRDELPSASLAVTLPGEGLAEVQLRAERTALGLLQIALTEADGRAHVLAFDLRGLARTARTSLPPGPWRGARELVRTAFQKDAPVRKVKDLGRELDKLLGERASWPGDRLRELADELLELRGARRLSADHERVFWHLLGYCQRPGRGAPDDERRLRELSKLYEQKLTFPDRTQNWQAFFIAFRRVASGLSAALQAQIAEDLAPSVVPGRKPKKKGRVYELGREEAAELLASLEHAPHELRAALGAALVDRSYVQLTPRIMTDLARLGARTPFYAPVTQALPPAVIEGWLEALLRAPWSHSAPFVEGALTLAQLTGDRARDLREPARRDVARKLTAIGVGEAACAPLFEVVERPASAALSFYGDALPLGLRFAP